jgi:hypothetical protein
MNQQKWQPSLHPPQRSRHRPPRRYHSAHRPREDNAVHHHSRDFTSLRPMSRPCQQRPAPSTKDQSMKDGASYLPASTRGARWASARWPATSVEWQRRRSRGKWARPGSPTRPRMILHWSSARISLAGKPINRDESEPRRHFGAVSGLARVRTRSAATLARGLESHRRQRADPGVPAPLTAM